MSTCLPPDVVKLLRELKRKKEIKSFSEAIREAVNEKFGNKILDIKNQKRIFDYVKTKKSSQLGH